MSDVVNALNGLDAARRAGWARAYALADEVARLQSEVDRLQADKLRLDRWLRYSNGAGPVRAALRSLGWDETHLRAASINTILRSLAVALERCQKQ